MELSLAFSCFTAISGGTDDPIREILHLEFVFALNLMQSIHSSLSAISRAIKGTQLPEKKTMECANALLHFQVHFEFFDCNGYNEHVFMHRFHPNGTACGVVHQFRRNTWKH